MAAVVARVTNLTGQAFARDPDGNLRQLRSGDPVREGEVVQTADGGRVQLTTVDGRAVSLGAGEAIKLDAEVAAPDLPDATTSSVQATQPVLAKVSRTVVGQDGTFSFDDDGGKGLGGSDQRDGHTFVELARIIETVDPLAFQFSTTRFPLTDTIQGGTVLPVLVSAGVLVAGQLDPASDSGIAGDLLTNDATPTLVGTATPGVTIEVATPFGVLTTVATAAGTWTLTLPSALPGAHSRAPSSAARPLRASSSAPATSAAIGAIRSPTPSAAPDARGGGSCADGSAGRGMRARTCRPAGNRKFRTRAGCNGITDR